MSPNFIQEQLSWAYVRAVIFRAGYRLYMPEVDDHGIDGTVGSYSGGVNRVDFQLKATTQYTMQSGYVIYDLRVQNYNQLIKEDDLPRILVLFLMPANHDQWLTQTPDELCLRYCAYWVSLMGMAPSGNTSTVRVSVPLSNMFDRNGLADMFSQLIV